jgi:hypothetical protein
LKKVQSRFRIAMFVDAIKQFRGEVLEPRHDYGHTSDVRQT